MAQRTIHYLFADKLSEQIELKDKVRFLTGSIMPDANMNKWDRDVTHFKVKTDTEIYFDFDVYREKFKDLIFEDDLYLGYYMHLVEDAFYRQFIYCGRFTMPTKQEEVTILHNDYHILNAYIVEKYKLTNKLVDYFNMEKESINQIAKFDINGFIADMSNDFTEQVTGKTNFFTEAMVDEFMSKYLPIGLQELENIQNGKFGLKAKDFSWLRNR